MSVERPSPPPANTVSRRTFLRTLGIAGGGVVVAPAFVRTPASAQETPSPLRPDPTAKRGSTLRYAVHNAPAHFDVHQSGTVANIGPQSPMYDTLLRRSPKDGQTIIPDLAQRWEISPNGKKYTFYLRKGVKFHDGADFTAEDVKATYDRIAHPPKGVVIPRTPLFATVGEIVVVDPHKIEFRLTEPRPKAFMLGAFASGWNIIVRKKTLDENQGNLRQVMTYPGTGPFKHVSRKDKEVWIMERNPDYWNKGLPLVDRLEVYHMMPFSAELGSAFLSGKLDYARLLDPVSWRKAKEMQGVTAAAFNQSVIQAVWMNMKKKPLADVRVRRAMHLAMDRHTLVEVVKDTAPMQVGGFVYLAIRPLVSWLRAPSDSFGPGYGRDGPQNYSYWTTPGFHALANQIERERDDTRRKAMARKGEDILEQDPPLIPVSYEQIYDAWNNKVHGQNPSTYFGIYDVVRWDQVWLA